MQHAAQQLILNHVLTKNLLIWFVFFCCLLCRTELTKSVVLPELIELSRDEGSSVRLAAFETLVNLLDIFDTGESPELCFWKHFVFLFRVTSRGGSWLQYSQSSWCEGGVPSPLSCCGPSSLSAFSAATFPLLAPGGVVYSLPLSLLSSACNWLVWRANKNLCWWVSF